MIGAEREWFEHEDAMLCGFGRQDHPIQGCPSLPQAAHRLSEQPPVPLPRLTVVVVALRLDPHEQPVVKRRVLRSRVLSAEAEQVDDPARLADLHQVSGIEMGLDHVRQLIQVISEVMNLARRQSKAFSDQIHALKADTAV